MPPVRSNPAVCSYRVRPTGSIPMNDEINPDASFAGDAGDDESMLADASASLAREKERSQRLAADFDNYRKRTVRDSEQQAAAQKDAFIRELLPVVDNLE